jgi:uncharacterized MnhB-related membrane protein
MQSLTSLVSQLNKKLYRVMDADAIKKPFDSQLLHTESLISTVRLRKKMDPATLVIEIILLGFIVVFGVLAVEFKRLVYAAVSLALMSISIALIFFLLSAPFVGVLQLLIYAGAITILFLATISLTKGEEEE